MNKQNFFKWFKRGTLILAIIPILLFLGFAGAVSLIDFNQYKPQIEQEVAKVTGRDFKITGAVDVSILPFMFNVGQMYLRNTEAFTEENLLSIREVQIELSLSSLFLDKEISVISLELIEPKLHLIKTETGDNWSDIELISQWLPVLPGLSTSPSLAHLTPSLNRENHPQTSSEWFDTLKQVQVNTVVHHEEPKSSFDWAFDSLVIRQGELQLEDQVTGHLTKLSAINILTFDVIKGQPFDVSSEFTYQHSPSLRTYDFHLNTTLEITDHFQKWVLTSWDGLFKFNLPVEDNVPAVRLTTSGERFELDLQTRNVNVVKARLAGLDAELTTSFSGLFGVNSALSGSVDLMGLNFKDWAYHLGLPLPVFIDQKALTEGNGQFEWQWDGQKLLLKEIELQVDQTKLKGSVSYQVGEEPALKFDLSLDQLNLDTYLAEYKTEYSKEPSPTEMTRPGQINLDSAQTSPRIIPKASMEHYLPVGLPIENLRNLTASGQLRIDQLSAWDVKASSLQATLQAEQGRLSFAPLDAELYQGLLRSKFILDVTQETPNYHWKGRLNQINLQMALASNIDNTISDGVMTSRFDLQSEGLSNKALKKNLHGLFSSELEQVKIKGLDLNQLLNGTLETQATSTLLESVYLAGKWHQGVYSAKRFSANSERFSGSGSGTYDLNTAEIDSQFLLAIEKPTQALSLLKGVVVPLSYQGSLQAKNEIASEKFAGKGAVYEKARWKVDMTKLMASPAYHPQQKQLITTLSSLLQ